MSGVLEQPSGTVTLVFTDIEGSTRLLRELGEGRYQEVLADHRRVVRAACARYRGYEVGCEGDSFFYAFASAQAALDAVRETQDGLGGGPIRIRVGIHTGEPGLDPPDNYVGLDVHEAARIMAAAHGGQVVLSHTTRELVDADTLDLGEHRLKDLEQPVRLHQLGRERYPPLRSLNNTNLPAPVSLFLGRERELAEAEALLAGTRLLTVTGVGGIGKTRFAIELASRQLDEFPGGTFWVGLATLHDPRLVLSAIAQTLGAQDDLASFIGDRRIMLVLDNLEHVIESASELGGLMRACPQLRLLVTSRELLQVQGEREYPLRPLADEEGVRLFCDRAGTEPSETIERLCSRLENLPLAIELAAARSRLLSPDELLGRIGQRLDLLRGGRDSDPRQQTLRATIAWSHDLLVADEQRLFARLSVFPGGCTLAAAEAVAGAHLDVLQSLLDKSLLQRTGERFWMFETIREFAAEQQSGADRAETTTRFCTFYIEQLEPLGKSRKAWERPAYFDAEIDNVRLALDLLHADGEAEHFGWIVCATSIWWEWRGFTSEMLTRVEAALAFDELSDALRAELFERAAEAATELGDARLAEFARAGRELFRKLGDPHGESLCADRLSAHALEHGDVPLALRLSDEALDLAVASGDADHIAITRLSRCLTLLRCGETDGVAETAAEVLVHFRTCAVPAIVAMPLTLLAELELSCGDVEQAIGFAEQALAEAAAANITSLLVDLFALLAIAERRRGDLRRAARLLGTSEQLRDRHPSWTLDLESRLDELRAEIAEADVEEERAVGRALPLPAAVRFALDTDIPSSGRDPAYSTATWA
jgi:predicted ATPase/class 3 adenylate cyclase